MSAMLGNDEKRPSLSDTEIRSNCTALILGGSETISSALSGTTYYLTTNPSTLAKAVTEVRSAFKQEEDITMTSTGQLQYLNAAISEAMRLFPPFSGASPRVVPPGGAEIGGTFIPGNVSDPCTEDFRRRLLTRWCHVSRPLLVSVEDILWLLLQFAQLD